MASLHRRQEPRRGYVYGRLIYWYWLSPKVQGPISSSPRTILVVSLVRIVGPFFDCLCTSRHLQHVSNGCGEEGAAFLPKSHGNSLRDNPIFWFESKEFKEDIRLIAS